MEEKMRYRVSIEMPCLEWDLDAESPKDAFKEAIAFLDDTCGDLFLDDLGIDLKDVITVEPIEASQQDRGEQEG